MNDKKKITRRGIITGVLSGACAFALAGCEKLSGSAWFLKVLSTGENATHKAQRLIIPHKAMAQEFPEKNLSHGFRSNGTAFPVNIKYSALAAGQFKDYRLEVNGLVEKPSVFTLSDIRALPDRTQITRHDCVEGWSAIGKWRGAQFSALLEAVKLKPEARYIVFYCFDFMEQNKNSFYYESIDMEDALHPQTILAYELNDAPLPVKNGAPLRLRLERQLGYKMAKYIERIEVVENLSGIAFGKGGYWEDRGYEWYAGI